MTQVRTPVRTLPFFFAFLPISFALFASLLLLFRSYSFCSFALLIVSLSFSSLALLLELEPIQTHKTQKPLLLVEVGARAVCRRSKSGGGCGQPRDQSAFGFH
jgi:hypothetical protein